MQIISITDPQAISLACQALGRGELVIFPTETCYGLAADATNPAAVSRLLAYKGDRQRQVAVAVADRAMAAQYVAINDIADNLYTHFLPGPLTIISESLHRIDARLESASGTLGVRVPNYPFTQLLIATYTRPLTATSANTSGKKEPYSLPDWQKYTTPARQAMVSLFLDAGKLIERPTSTVVDTTLNDPLVLRQGEFVFPLSSPSFTSHSPTESQTFAAQLLRQHLNLLHRFPLIIALQGDLGAGKTQFAKGIAAALGLAVNVSSPTYTLMREYPFGSPGSELSALRSVSEGEFGTSAAKYSGTLYHIDTWRLTDPAEIESTLHLSKLLKPGNVVVIEWAGKAKNVLESYQKEYPILLIDIKETDPYTRTITYSLSTPEWS